MLSFIQRHSSWGFTPITPVSIKNFHILLYIMLFNWYKTIFTNISLQIWNVIYYCVMIVHEFVWLFHYTPIGPGPCVFPWEFMINLMFIVLNVLTCYGTLEASRVLCFYMRSIIHYEIPEWGHRIIGVSLFPIVCDCFEIRVEMPWFIVLLCVSFQDRHQLRLVQADRKGAIRCKWRSWNGTELTHDNSDLEINIWVWSYIDEQSSKQWQVLLELNMSGKLEIFFFEADFHVSRLSGVLGDVLMAGMVSLGSEGPQFKFRFAVELRPGGVDSACHPSEAGKNEYQLARILCRSGDPSRIMPDSPGNCLGSTNALHRECSQWMDRDWASSSFSKDWVHQRCALLQNPHSTAFQWQIH